MEVARYVCYEKGQNVNAAILEGTVIHRNGWDGLQRAPELSKKKPRRKADENLIDASGVGYHAGKGRFDELKHLDREIRKTPLISARFKQRSTT
ncbi:hypothetical protein AX14_000693 [Amanita brunnescens Koide BX004]|nr:hypothetical protein AX14_000693 [Amanita brunnescens Koide BX004]